MPGRTVTVPVASSTLDSQRSIRAAADLGERFRTLPKPEGNAMQRNFLSIPSIAVVALGVLVSGCADRDTPAPAKVERVDQPDAEPAPSDEKKPKPPEPDGCGRTLNLWLKGMTG